MEKVAEGSQVAEGPLASTLARLDHLSEDELLTVIGAESLTPLEQTSATVLTYASAEAAEALEREQFAIRGMPVNLIVRGRRRVGLILAEWGDRIKDEVCPFWRRDAPARDLAVNIAGLLLLLLQLPWALLLGIALYIAKYLIDKLCEGDLPPLELVTA